MKDIKFHVEIHINAGEDSCTKVIGFGELEVGNQYAAKVYD